MAGLPEESSRFGSTGRGAGCYSLKYFTLIAALSMLAAALLAACRDDAQFDISVAGASAPAPAPAPAPPPAAPPVWIAAWDSTENLGGTAGTDADIFVARSSDDGVTWSAVEVLNSSAITDINGDLNSSLGAP